LESILFGWDNCFTIPIHCGLFKASLLKDFTYNENVRAKEDWIMWITIFLNDPKSIFLDKELVLYRSHSKSKVTNFTMMNENLHLANKIILSLLPINLSNQFAIFLLDKYVQKNSLLEKEIEFNRFNSNKIKASKSYKLGNAIILFFYKITFSKPKK
jgi:hypothetical protein